MLRYLEISWLMIRNSLIREMSFKGNFLLWITVDLLWFVGQLVFIAAASLVILGLRRLRTRLPFDMPAVARLAPAYAIGGLSAYGRVARLAGLF